LRCVTCPHCKTLVDAKLDKSAGTIECLNNRCRAKVNQKGQRIDKFASKKPEKDFGTLLIELFFGNTAEIQAKKRAAVQKKRA